MEMIGRGSAFPLGRSLLRANQETIAKIVKGLTPLIRRLGCERLQALEIVSGRSAAPTGHWVGSGVRRGKGACTRAVTWNAVSLIHRVFTC